MFCLWCVEPKTSPKEDILDQSEPMTKSAMESSNQPSKNVAKASTNALKKAKKAKRAFLTAGEAGLSPTSSSCPQLTVEEATDPEESSDIESKDTSAQSTAEETSMETSTKVGGGGHCDHGHNNSLVTKTYSFRRMLSFRGSSLRRRGNSGGSSLEETTCSSPGLHPSQRPLQFSFLGQIYKTKSSSGMSSSSSSKKQRRCASQKVTTSTSSSRNHVLESSNEDFTLNSDSAKNLSTQVILEN